MSFTALAEPLRDFRHEAFLYDGADEFFDGVISFVYDGVANNEPTLVVVDASKLGPLRAAFKDVDNVYLADMREVGKNPARIIPAWREFVQTGGALGKNLRGVGEPIGRERVGDELIECQQHESLLNASFSGGRAWWLLCPYDVSLDEEVIAEARRTHPFVFERGHHKASATHREAETKATLGQPLPVPEGTPSELLFVGPSVHAVRGFVRQHARGCGLGPARTEDLVIAANELATNSLQHGGGHGTVRIWRTRDTLLCEVSDSGQIDDPLVGRRRPSPEATSSRGLWLSNALCDLVQIRSFATGTRVRVHMRLGSTEV